ncbi:hypothetical protein GGR56DRAFT_4784 [Xylariaceae sp. FL0804]|nr:hypothetical protein GGR56DRAFT_4784 [Xylariaceae sp. FL0804]
MMLAHNYTSRNHQPYQYYTHPPQQQQQQQTQHSTQPQPHQQSQQQQFTFGSNALDNIPAAAAAIAASQRYRTPSVSSQTYSLDRGSSSNQGQSLSQSLSQVPDLMPSDPWMLSNQQTPRGSQRFGSSHQRESSLSSLGSNGPASPYNANTSNPQIAVTDAGTDGLMDMSGVADNNYSFNLGKPMQLPDNFYANAISAMAGTPAGSQNATADINMIDGLSSLANQQQKRGGLAPAAELSTSGSTSRSRPVSVASSVTGGDSPATPTFHELEDDGRRQKNAYAHGKHVPPKLDRTITDVYSDELYNPNFTLTSASPPQTQLALSPSNELFAERLQAANSQRLSAAQTPVSGTPRGHSPFRQGSPYASTLDDFSNKVVVNQVRLESAQRIREKRKAEQDAKEQQQQMARNTTQQQSTPPKTISPKDALLDFNDSEDFSNAPLFPPEGDGFSAEQMGSSNSVASQTPQSSNRAMSQQSSPSYRSSPSYQSLASTPMQSTFNFSMPTSLQVPQQYPFVARPKQQPQPHSSTPSMSKLSRMSSMEANSSELGNGDAFVQRPGRTNADGGTYTCTYHGCTRRFETPALLQKHKREGHRQANTLTQHLGASPTPSLAAGSLLNSQAGPHRCDRINPSTGKPCSTVFSRPYDLTRHEDTIHNARKQKVRCDLCTEEKTFSRADALTRHYRVCHPDVEFPGKHRKRAVV